MIITHPNNIKRVKEILADNSALTFNKLMLCYTAFGESIVQDAHMPEFVQRIPPLKEDLLISQKVRDMVNSTLARFDSEPYFLYLDENKFLPSFKYKEPDLGTFTK